MSYTFRKIKNSEVPQFFGLILERMEWMNQNGMRHWNIFEYDKMYPISYYEEKSKAGELYVLTNDMDEIVSGAVLPEVDIFWNDVAPAYYIHNFASKVGVKGAGGLFMDEVERLARSRGKNYVRLDVLEGCEELAKYYEARGYKIRGRCESGEYHGILREKVIVPVVDCKLCDRND